MTKYQAMTKYRLINDLLLELQQQLEQNGHWQDLPPSDDMMNSYEPFSIDALSCSEWLQWVFIPKMKYLVKNNAPLPMMLAIAPYVQQSMQQKKGYKEIHQACIAIDALFEIHSN